MTTISEDVVGQRQSAKIIRPAVVALTAFVLYAATLTSLVSRGINPVAQAQVGKHFLNAGRGHSSAIDALRPYAKGRIGYDGQFALFVALSPRHAGAYMDDPGYRYERILYPMVARAVVAGDTAAIPWSLLILNVVAVVALAFAVALYLQQRGASPWFALTVALSPGLAIAAFRDLNEPLAYALVALGLLALWSPSRHRIVLAGSAFALGGLARESALLFAISASGCLAVGIGENGATSSRRMRDGIALAAISCLPLVAWKGVLAAVTDGLSVPARIRPVLVPFQGLLGQTPFSGEDVRQLLLVVLPGCLALVIALICVRRLTAPIVALCVNWLVVLALLPKDSYWNVPTAARVSIAVPLAFLYCVPQITGRKKLLVVVPAILWLVAWL
jgi:hypothetical protein